MNSWKIFNVSFCLIIKYFVSDGENNRDTGLLCTRMCTDEDELARQNCAWQHLDLSQPEANLSGQNSNQTFWWQDGRFTDRHGEGSLSLVIRVLPPVCTGVQTWIRVLVHVLKLHTDDVSFVVPIFALLRLSWFWLWRSITWIISALLCQTVHFSREVHCEASGWNWVGTFYSKSAALLLLPGGGGE